MRNVHFLILFLLIFSVSCDKRNGVDEFEICNESDCEYNLFSDGFIRVSKNSADQWSLISSSGLKKVKYLSELNNEYSFINTR